VKAIKGVLWVENHCCKALRSLDRCEKTDELPCKCKNQRACRKQREAEGIVAGVPVGQEEEEAPPPPSPPAPPMGAGDRSGLNSDCAKWRDQGSKSKGDQLENMVGCMNQDCAQSMEEITCDFVTPETGGEENAGLCYTNPGQVFCVDHPTSPDCKRRATWTPVKDIAFRGESPRAGSGVTAEGTFSCVCAKKCAYWKSQRALRCAEGWEMLGYESEEVKVSRYSRDGDNDTEMR